MKPLDDLRPLILSQIISYPRKLFGHDQSLFKKANCVVTDIMETVSAMLLEEDVVGRNGENFIWKYTSEYNADNERTYGNVTSANWFRRTEKDIHNQWGKDVNLLGLSIACDKTHVDRLGGISVHPCYVTILNLDGCIRRTAKGSEIIGYCPILPYSNEEFKKVLREQCTVRRDLDDVVKMVKFYFEQSFLNKILAPIIKIRKEDPIALAVGSKIGKFIPEIMAYVCKYFTYYSKLNYICTCFRIHIYVFYNFDVCILYCQNK